MAPPDTTERAALLQAASDAQRCGDRDGAAAALDRLLRRAPRDGQALHMRGVLALADGEVEAAAGFLERAVAVQPDALMLANLGIALAGCGRDEDAEDVLRSAVAQTGSPPQAAYNLGHLLAARGADGEARTWLQAAVRDAPAYTRASCELAALLLRAGEAEGAQAVLRAALEHEPEHPVALHHMGLALRLLGRHEEACASFLRARPALGPDRELMLGLGASLQECGRVEEALAVYRELLAVLPDAFGQVLCALSSASHGCFALRPSRMRALLGLT